MKISAVMDVLKTHGGANVSVTHQGFRAAFNLTAYDGSNCRQELVKSGVRMKDGIIPGE